MGLTNAKFRGEFVPADELELEEEEEEDGE
jgi:hypothetical protein